MSIVDLFQEKTVFSFEVFPPRRNSPIETIYDTLDELRDLKPDFISVTYGAGGGKNNQSTIPIAEHIKKVCEVPSVVHFPCINLTKQDVLEKIEELKNAGIKNILALRGDIPEGKENRGDFRYASDLIAFLKEHGNFHISAACYPEGHIESADRVEDIRYLKNKVDAGAEHLISQLFFENKQFYIFQERCALAGIDVPIEAGIMPVINKRQVLKMASLCGVKVPKKFQNILDKYEDNPIAMRDAGIAYAVDQIVDLVTHGVDGVHLYTMNNPYIARKIYKATHSLFESTQKGNPGGSSASA